MQTKLDLDVADCLKGPDFTPSGVQRIIVSDGFIEKITPQSSVDVSRRLLAMPALVDAHNHCRGLSTTSFGAGLKPLETWLPQLATLPSVDPYLSAICSFGRSATGGCTSVMVHLTRAMGFEPLPDEALKIAKAAKDVGVAIGFALAMRDQNPLIYDDPAPLLNGLPKEMRKRVEAIWLPEVKPPEFHLKLVDEVASALRDFDHPVDIQYGPTGVQWCSTALLSAIAEASALTGRRVHMHLLETKPQRDWADGMFPGGIVNYLNDIGLLSPRLTLAHCVWAREEELALLAEKGVRISVNPSSNLHLSSGIASVARMKAAGVNVAMGLDGCALDEDEDALREMRLFRLLNSGWGYGARLDLADILRSTCVNGRASLGLPFGGVLAEGLPADILILDLAAMDRDQIMAVDPRDYLFTRATKAHVVHLIANGRTILKEGRLTGLDLEAAQADLRARYRVAMKGQEAHLAAWRALEPHLNHHYQTLAGCC